jgi:aspartyl-tRNA synthetase
MCAEINENLAGREVTVNGWVHKRRDLGQLVFIVIRDVSGLVQAAADETKAGRALYEKAVSLRGEFVVSVTGTVVLRAEKDINPQMETGRTEIIVTGLEILAEAETTPFSLLDEGVREDIRLKYRYIDLRRPELQKVLITRHNAARIIREYLSANRFIEVETPVLANASPEGARDYLVPSRIHRGCFYALPQSPQVFKQLLMVAGLDRYFQIAKCFRDEDLRADRQPEFTQIDIEMSFCGIDDVIGAAEGMIAELFKEIRGIDVKLPIKRMTYEEAMTRFGSDKPDLRYGLEIADISGVVSGAGFGAFQSALDAGGSVRALVVPGGGGTPRKQIDRLAGFAEDCGAKGLAWVQVQPGGEVKSPLTKFLGGDVMAALMEAVSAGPGDLILICAGDNKTALEPLGALRQEIAKTRGLIDESAFSFVWITEFPLYEWNEEDKRLYAAHHPFTAPMDEDKPLLDTAPEKVRSKAYDLVINGYEAGGGSLRINRLNEQMEMFGRLGIDEERAKANFGHLLEAFRYGAPPHGGIAFGFDRLTMLLCGLPAIRDTIAFPKVKDASCPMTEAPGAPPPEQLDELGIFVKNM